MAERWRGKGWYWHYDSVPDVLKMSQSFAYARRVGTAHAIPWSQLFPGPGEAIQMHVACEYHVHGQQNFALTSEYVELFSQTSLRGITFNDVSMPYCAFYIALDCPGLFMWGGPRTRWHEVGGMYVCVMMTSVRTKAGTSDPGMSIATRMVGKPNVESTGPLDDATFDNNVRIDKDDDIEGLIAAMNAEDFALTLGDPAEEDLASCPGKFIGGGDPVGASRFAIRIACNLAMYLSSKGAVATKSVSRTRTGDKIARRAAKASASKRGRLRKDLMRHESYFTLIGETSKISKRDEPSMPSGSRVRHWVRGHWRRQRVGKNRADIEIIWIRPHQRGAEFAERMNRKAYILT